MREGLFRKCLVLGIMLLFIGASIIPSNASLKEGKNVQLLINQGDGVILNSWWNTNWSYRKQITINHNNVDSNFSYFPVLIHNISSDFSNHAQPDGDDFIFRTNDSVDLYHEIEYYDNSVGELIAWVNIPFLSSTEDTIIWLYYGNPNCGNQQNVEDVWDSDYVMVHHLEEISGIHFDSTSNNWDGNPGGVYQDYFGIIDGADWFDGSNDLIDITGSSGLEYNKMTISAWVKKEVQPAGQRIIVGKHQSAVKKGFYLGASGNKFNFYVGCPSPVTITTPDPYGLSWYYVVGTYDYGNMKLYVDGSHKISGTVSYMEHSSTTVNIGRIYTAGYWHGGIDEVRISNISRNSEWISTEYNNQNNPGSFISVGTEETVFPPTASFTYAPPNPTRYDIIQFTDTSTDPDGTIISWWWEFGDGYYSDLQNPIHCYYFDGSYDVSLTVTDNNSLTDTTQQTIVVFTPMNNPPVFGIPTPGNGSLGQPLAFIWSILISDPEGDSFSWSIECTNGQSNSAIHDSNGTKQLSISGLNYNTYYTVWVNATDPGGSGLYTREWFWFTTKTNNTPPDKPIIDGPTSGKAGVTYYYNFTINDIDGDPMFLWVNWDDGTQGPYTGPYESGIVNLGHTWSEEGDYTIRAKTKGALGDESEWGTLEVTMPLNQPSLHSQYFNIHSFIKRLML